MRSVSLNFSDQFLIAKLSSVARRGAGGQTGPSGENSKFRRKNENEGKTGRRKGEGEREGEEGRRKGKKENKRRKNGKIITTGIIIYGRKGWREGNGLDKVEHWFKYRWDEYTETGRARGRGKDPRE